MTNNQLTETELFLRDIQLGYMLGRSDIALIKAMAAELQERRKAAIDSEPVAWLAIYHGEVYDDAICITRSVVEAQADHFGWESALTELIPLYRHAQQPVVPDESYQQLSELYHAQEKRLFKIAQRIKGSAFDKYSHSPSQAIDVLECAIFGEDEACRAAMLAAAPQSIGSDPATVPGKWIPVSEHLPDPKSEQRVCVYTPTPHEDMRYRFVPASLFRAVCSDATHWYYMEPPAAPQEVPDGK